MAREKSKKYSIKMKSAKNLGNIGQIKFNKNYNKEEFIRDIKLDLDKYIFNFDESILKYISAKENNIKNNKNNSTFNNIIQLSPNNLNDNKNLEKNEQKIDVEIGNIELFWTNQDALTKNLVLDKNESDTLLDLPPAKWKFVIEKNIKKYLSDEFNVIKPNRRASTNIFGLKHFITSKEK